MSQITYSVDDVGDVGLDQMRHLGLYGQAIDVVPAHEALEVFVVGVVDNGDQVDPEVDRRALRRCGSIKTIAA